MRETDGIEDIVKTYCGIREALMRNGAYHSDHLDLVSAILTLATVPIE